MLSVMVLVVIVAKLGVEGEGEVVFVCGFKQLRYAATRFTSHDAGLETVYERMILEERQLGWAVVNILGSPRMPIGNDTDLTIFILSGRYIARDLECPLVKPLLSYECRRHSM